MGRRDIETVLQRNNISFTKKDIQYGCQFVFGDGAKLAVYDKGSTLWQGTDSPTKVRVEGLLEGLPSQNAHATSPKHASYNTYNNKVFIVYGHDTEAREQLELLLRRLKLEPVVIQNLPTLGHTIIEKLESESNVTFACVLLTPDDKGYSADNEDEIRPRARQNVVLEMGMFLARLGRKRVAILHKGNVELPSDIQGLLYIPFKRRIDEVKDRVAAELQGAGFQIDIKDLLS